MVVRPRSRIFSRPSPSIRNSRWRMPISAFMSWNIGQTDLGAEEVRIAYEFRDRVSDRERRYILMLYDRQVTGNLQKELQTLESWAQTYPRDLTPPALSAGWVAQGTGQYERGIQAAQEAIRLDPDIPFPVSESCHPQSFPRPVHRGRGGLAAGGGAQTGNPGISGHPLLPRVSKGDQAGMDREIARAPGEHAEDRMSHHQALVLARSGRMRQARIMWERAIASAQQAGKRETAAIYEAAAGGVRSAFRESGSGEEARSGGAGTWQKAAMWSMPRRLRWRFQATFRNPKGSPPTWRNASPRIPLCNSSIFPRCTLFPRSLIGRRRTRSSDCNGRFPTTSPCRARHSSANSEASIPRMCAVRHTLQQDVARRPRRNFRKVLDHRGIVFADPIGALAHLQLGRAYVISGDMTKAKSAYQDFLTLWKDADPDIPVLKQASAEYAKL